MADRFDKFTERARQALLAAQSEAIARRQNYVGTEHLLLGLLRQVHSQEGPAAEAAGPSAFCDRFLPRHYRNR